MIVPWFIDYTCAGPAPAVSLAIMDGDSQLWLSVDQGLLVLNPGAENATVVARLPANVTAATHLALTALQGFVAMAQPASIEIFSVLGLQATVTCAVLAEGRPCSLHAGAPLHTAAPDMLLAFVDLPDGSVRLVALQGPGWTLAWSLALPHATHASRIGQIAPLSSSSLLLSVDGQLLLLRRMS
jgi:hypothetical protein